VFGIPWGVWGWIGESDGGEWRTGPALNPLKGSSARLPHAKRCATSTPFLTSLFSMEWNYNSK
jgi:hypothetical protein